VQRKASSSPSFVGAPKAILPAGTSAWADTDIEPGIAYDYFVERTIPRGARYLVRAVKLEVTASGSFYNPSQAAIVDAPARSRLEAPAMRRPDVPAPRRPR
jgi:hypothetical protein